MNWDLLKVVTAIILVAFLLVDLWGVGKLWKGSKFLSFVFILIAVAIVIFLYFLYGKAIFG